MPPKTGERAILPAVAEVTTGKIPDKIVYLQN
jgi:hypothetical protein